MNPSLVAVIIFAVLVIVVLVKTAVIVPQKHEYIIERLGKYSRTLGAGFHILLPFIDKVAYRFMLKEEVVNIASQTCITKDNVTVEVDGLIYLQVQDSKLAAYGINDYRIASAQLAQTTLRSCIGRIDLDKTFEERENINAQVVQAIDEAAQSWGIKLLRYEVSDIVPPQSVKQAMEAQMTAERAKRAEIAKSEGERQSTINRAEGERQDAILKSEGEKQRMINEAEGRAAQIRAVAEATAQGLHMIAEQLKSPGGLDAANLRVAEQYVAEFGKLAKESNTLIVPSSASDVSSMVSHAMATLNTLKKS
ncbi:SPFH domain-containing protein [Desulfuromonas acetoxidans]|uniref:Band 7 protein n=1 Tax=Desulfuromonas acetoxidans (strain DSM 684 / 11070) TaxID=281689 RepID=Q1K3F2_DESA6|nr:SPFH domain-containing protein [Desulfuromonas acetoxidans]EAT17022.1 band 7 protein [Desulfuromonas acetoxidans DSM 684]MBF0645168.1 SPFH/Band 7/PHB domain protein [Desulfuromonas acetoxidans]NVD24028.1 SPFH/Band 7/PHB domain protein [Desulfuromonas acetoxidans]NVE16324.1 SPFH/Band 7/PHB domain protein [Desulfuromonas acetoxidans]